MYKIISLLMMCALLATSCFRTRTNAEEEQKIKHIRDSIHSDSVNTRRNTPDTVLATYKRSMECDGKFFIVFDRVKVLSGKEAAEYSLRHKRFGNNVNVVVNQEVSLETLPLEENAPIYIYDKVPNKNDSTKYHYEYRLEDKYAIEEMPFEQVIEIIILHRNIVYVKQREL